MKLARTGAVAAALLAGPLLTACSSHPGPDATAASFLADWARRDWGGMRDLVRNPPADFAAVNADALTDLSVRRATYQGGRVRVSGAAASEPVTEHLQLAGLGTVTLRTELRLSQVNGSWVVDWSPATIAPQLERGGRLSLQLDWPGRAQILGAGGQPLTTRAPMVTVGVEGQRIKDARAVSRALLAAGAPAAALARALTSAKARPSWFEPVYTITMARYQQLKPRIYPIPGTVFQTTGEIAPLTPGLSYLVGAAGPVTAQQLGALGPPYTAASVVGQTGLEGAYERQLAGRPAATIVATSADGSRTATVATLPARPGTAVRTSIDPRIQRAAETALAGLRQQAALVAVNAATGDVLAAAVRPAGTGFNIALDGSFPPGSAFKVITSTALIEHGLRPGSAASCPQRVTVDGAVFHNSEGTGPVRDLLHAFAESCNTAFIRLATRHLGAADLPAAAAQYGLGTEPNLGLTAYGGSVPKPADEAELAATAIGQGRVLVSPLDMAMVAAAVDSGQVRSARLVAGVGGSRAAAPRRLPAAVRRGLHTMMAQVVATGTASGQGLPAGTFAKTGTAQYGSGHPLPQDAWLMGFNGCIAFAMLVINGGEGGPTDGPHVAKFLDLVISGR